MEESKEIAALKAASWTIHATKILKLTLIPWGKDCAECGATLKVAPTPLGFNFLRMNVEEIEIDHIPLRKWDNG